MKSWVWIIRTWTATNECGDQTVASQTIRVRDREPVNVTCEPNNLGRRCTGVTTNIAIANTWNNANIEKLKECSTDNCEGEVTVTSDFDMANNIPDCGGNTGTINTVYTLSDECGNTTIINGALITVD